MKNIGFWLLGLLVAIGCAKDDTGRRTGLTQSSTDGYVEAADGSLYSISCLRALGSQLQSADDSIINSCLVDDNSLQSSVGGDSSTQSSGRGRLAYNNCSTCSGSGTSASYIYYPPTYYAPQSYYNFPVYYNPWQDNRYRNDTFCGFIFGGQNSVNCYYVFGYQKPSYTNSYQPTCTSSCLYSLNYGTCMQNACVKPVYYNGYTYGY